MTFFSAQKSSLLSCCFLRIPGKKTPVSFAVYISAKARRDNIAIFFLTAVLAGKQLLITVCSSPQLSMAAFKWYLYQATLPFYNKEKLCKRKGNSAIDATGFGWTIFDVEDVLGQQKHFPEVTAPFTCSHLIFWLTQWELWMLWVKFAPLYCKTLYLYDVRQQCGRRE